MKTGKFKNRLRQVLRGLGCAAIVAGMSMTASADLQYFVDFNDGTATNQGDAGGVATVGSGVTIANGVATFDGTGLNGGGLIETGLTLSGIGIDDGLGDTANGGGNAYAMMATINVPQFNVAGHNNGDGMIFGQSSNTGPNDTYLHNGVRGDRAHLGHWGADTTSNQVLQTNTEYTVLYQYSNAANGASAGFQTISVFDASGNVLNVTGAAGRQGIRSDGPLTIGTTSGQERGFIGTLDNLMVFDNVLQLNQAQHIASGGALEDTPAAAADVNETITGMVWVQDKVTGKWNSASVVSKTATDIINPNSTNYDWEQARQDALSKGGRLGQPAHLAANNAFNGLPGNDQWIDVTDHASLSTEGTWIISGSGEHVWTGLGINDGGTGVPGTFNAFVDGVEPNNAGGEDVAALVDNNGPGRWNDLPLREDIRRAYILERNEQLDSKPLIANTQLGGVGFFGVTTVEGIESTNTYSVESALNSGTGTVSKSTASMINYVDPDTNATAGKFAGDNAFPNDNAGVDDNNFGHVARGVIEITEDGDYTFGFTSDDGSSLRILGAQFRNATVLGDPAGNGPYGLHTDAMGNNSDTLEMTRRTGDSTTLGTTYLEAGTYNVEYVFNEAGGGAHAELYAAKGEHTVFNEDLFRPVGYQSSGGVKTVIKPGVGIDGWTTGTTPAGQTATTTLDAAYALWEESLDNETLIFGEHAQINFNGAGTDAGQFGGDIVFDNGSGDQFSMFATAELVIPADGQYEFGFQGDDGGFLQIEGAVWDGITVDVTGAAVIVGDTVITDTPTGNSHTRATTTLTAGTYTINVFFQEIGGGDYFEVFGNLVGGQTMLLTADGAMFMEIPDFDGIQLVPVPGAFGMSMVMLAGMGLRRGRRRQA